MGDYVTGDQVKEAVQRAGIKWVDHHDCSWCKQMVGYAIDGDKIFFCSGCGCSSSSPRQTAWSEVADFINRQSRTGNWGDVAARVAKGFGIDLEADSTNA